MADIQATLRKEDALIQKKATWTFAIFLIAITKDILVSGLKLIPERSPLNWQISYFFIMPIMILGLILSIQVVYHFFSTRKKRKYSYLLLAFPTLMCWLYGIVAFFVSVIYTW
jgi:hypothetical protein